MNDKRIEQERYNNKSANLLQAMREDDAALATLGADNFPLHVRPPYLHYHALISKYTYANTQQLDLCCGNGMHSFTGAKNGAKVIALDYAENSITIAKARARLLDMQVDFEMADVQTLSFPDNTFDVVTCAGSLSYLDHEIFLKGVYRVLKPGGVFICVDSLNHNPIYRLNRYIHYLRGERSYSTLVKMPTTSTIKLIGRLFSKIDVKYYGIFSFFAPVLKSFLSPEAVLQTVQKTDRWLSIFKKYSFKIVILATK